MFLPWCSLLADFCLFSSWKSLRSVFMTSNAMVGDLHWNSVPCPKSSKLVMAELRRSMEEMIWMQFWWHFWAVALMLDCYQKCVLCEAPRNTHNKQHKQKRTNKTRKEKPQQKDPEKQQRETNKPPPKQSPKQTKPERTQTQPKSIKQPEQPPQQLANRNFRELPRLSLWTEVIMVCNLKMPLKEGKVMMFFSWLESTEALSDT